MSDFSGFTSIDHSERIVGGVVLTVVAFLVGFTPIVTYQVVNGGTVDTIHAYIFSTTSRGNFLSGFVTSFDEKLVENSVLPIELTDHRDRIGTLFVLTCVLIAFITVTFLIAVLFNRLKEEIYAVTAVVAVWAIFNGIGFIEEFEFNRSSGGVEYMKVVITTPLVIGLTATFILALAVQSAVKNGRRQAT